MLFRSEAALAAFDAAAASYRAAVLSSFQDVANVLRALQLDAEALRVQLYAEQTASQSLDIVQERFRAGAVSYISLLDAERTYQQARIALVQAQANRYADTVALFVALGGGWWNRDDGKTSDTIMNTANSNVPTTPATPAKSDTAPAAVKPKP